MMCVDIFVASHLPGLLKLPAFLHTSVHWYEETASHQFRNEILKDILTLLVQPSSSRRRACEAMLVYPLEKCVHRTNTSFADVIQIQFVNGCDEERVDFRNLEICLYVTSQKGCR